MIYKSVFSSPLGYIEILSADAQSVTALRFTPDPSKDFTENSVTAEAVRQLGEYFSGNAKSFNLPLAPDGTAFEKSVWTETLKIPYGETRTYKEIAAAVGDEKSARAVGNALNKNPIPLIIPCHRVIGARNFLSGFAYGTMMKEALLNFEKNINNVSSK